MAEHRLLQRLGEVRRRVVAIGVAAGAGWGLVALLVLLILFAWVDLVLDLSSVLRAACAWLALLAGAALLARKAFAALRGSTRAALARRLDEVGGGRGQILAGVDLLHQYGGQAVAGAPLSRALAAIAVQRAERLAGSVRAAAAAPAKPLSWSYSVVGILLAAVGILSLASPRLVATQWARFTDPFGDHPPYASIDFQVNPGDVRLVYGSPLDVRATPVGGTVDKVELTFRTNDGTVESVPMFPEPGGAWRATIADVTLPGRYDVHGPGARSRQFHFDVITVPEWRGVRFRITPPAYTHRPPYEGPLPQGGIAGLPGTKVQLWAKSNRPLAGGTIDLAGAPATAPSTQPANTAKLVPIAPNASEVTGSFTIDRAGKLVVSIADVEGQPAREPFTAPVTLLTDERPFVRVMEPRPQSFATPDTALNVVMLAEDDYGLSRLQLFRGLNTSSVRATDIAVPADQPTRFQATVPLNLSDYGLMPGDVVKLYARVEDNDPAGAKGFESPIISVQIISKEEMNRMLLARQGLEVFEAKYAQAARRLEALDNQIKKLQEDLDKLDPNSELARQKQEELKQLAGDMEKAADDVAEAAKENLPFDLDRALRGKLDEVSQSMREAAKAAKDLAGQKGLSVAGAKKRLNDIRNRLGTKRDEFKKDAADPLEHLAKIFPLKEDEARFLELYQQQRDLAERMHSLESAGAADPHTRVRMRELEDEQRGLRRELQQLLDDIDNHVAALPDDKRLDDLRKSAGEFAQAVRKSAAAGQMTAAEEALADFSGTPAAQRATDAANTLEKFIGQCKSMGQEGEACLRFQPTLAQALGNTVQQLLDAEGLGPSKSGNGVGSGGGFSQRRSTLRNIGLYGGMPKIARASRTGGRSQSGAPGAGPDAQPDRGNAAALSASGRLQASGESDASVPPQYRRKVGEYFQRVSDELGDQQ